MDVAMTKMSQNGQVVIPVDIRKRAKIAPRSKFLVYTRGETILLKPVPRAEDILDKETLKSLRKSEEQIKKGQYITLDSNMSAEEMDKAIRDPALWKSHLRKNSRKNTKR